MAQEKDLGQILSYKCNLEEEISLFVDIKTAKRSIQIDFYNTCSLFNENVYFCHFGKGNHMDTKEIYDKIEGRFNLDRIKDLEFMDAICFLGAKYLTQDFGTIQKCLETYETDKYLDYTYNREMGWMYFGFLNAIYGSEARAVELLEKFIDSTLDYHKKRIGTQFERLNDEKNGQWFDFYRIRACQSVIIAIAENKSKEEIKNLVKTNTKLEKEESDRRDS